MAYHPPDDLDERVKALIRRKVKQLIGNYGFRPDDEEDLRQHLSQKVVAALPRHDPARASVATYANTVVNNGAASIAAHATAEKRDRRRERQPEESQSPRHDGIEAQTQLHLRLDVAEALKGLGERERMVATLFMKGYTQAEISRQPGLSRQIVRRVQNQLAQLLTERGLR